MPEFPDDYEQQRQKVRVLAPPPNKIGETIMRDHELVTDADTGVCYYYTGTHWAVASDNWLRHLALIADGNFATTSRRRGEIVDFVKNRTTQQNVTWRRVKDHEIPFRNGVLDVLTGELRPHDPQDYLERVVPWEFERAPRATPVWRSALKAWFGEDETAAGLIAALQEFYGYTLLPHAKYKRALLCYGDSNTGKSRVAATAIAMVGQQWTCSLSVEHMDDPVRRAVLLGKALNVATELTTEALRADSGFKTLVSTEEPILIDQKYLPAFMYRPTAKHLFATNVLPRITERSEEILNRLLLIPMNRVMEDEEQDRDLDDKLAAEMAGIIQWAVEGARRLVERDGHWEIPPASVDAVKKYREDWNPAIAFIHENCEPQAVTSEGKVAGEVLSVLCQKFNMRRDGERALGQRQMGRLLRKAGFTIRKVRHDENVLATLVGWRWADRPRNSSMLLDAAEVVQTPEDHILEVRGTLPHTWHGDK